MDEQVGGLVRKATRAIRETFFAGGSVEVRPFDAESYNLVLDLKERAEENQRYASGKTNEEGSAIVGDDVFNALDFLDERLLAIEEFNRRHKISAKGDDVSVDQRVRSLASFAGLTEEQLRTHWHTAIKMRQRALRPTDDVGLTSQEVEEFTALPVEQIQNITWLTHLFDTLGADQQTVLNGELRDKDGEKIELIDRKGRKKETIRLKTFLKAAVVRDGAEIVSGYFEYLDARDEIRFFNDCLGGETVSKAVKMPTADEDRHSQIRSYLERADEYGLSDQGWQKWEARAALSHNLAVFETILGTNKFWKEHVGPLGQEGHTDWAERWLTLPGFATVLGWAELYGGGRDPETGKPKNEPLTNEMVDQIIKKARGEGINPTIARRAIRWSRMTKESSELLKVVKKVQDMPDYYALLDLFGYGRTLNLAIESMSELEKKALEKAIKEGSAFSMAIVTYTETLLGTVLNPNREDDLFRWGLGRPPVYADLDEEGEHSPLAFFIDRLAEEKRQVWIMRRRARHVLLDKETELPQAVEKRIMREAESQLRFEMYARETLRALAADSFPQKATQVRPKTGNLAQTPVPFNPESRLHREVLLDIITGPDSAFTEALIEVGLAKRQSDGSVTYNVSEDHLLMIWQGYRERRDSDPEASLVSREQGADLRETVTYRLNKAVYEYRVKHKWQFDYSAARAELGQALNGDELETALLILVLQDRRSWGQQVEIAHLDPRNHEQGAEETRKRIKAHLKAIGGELNKASLDEVFYKIFYEYDTYGKLLGAAQDFRVGRKTPDLEDLSEDMENIWKHRGLKRSVPGQFADYLRSFYNRYMVFEKWLPLFREIMFKTEAYQATLVMEFFKESLEELEQEREKKQTELQAVRARDPDDSRAGQLELELTLIENRTVELERETEALEEIALQADLESGTDAASLLPLSHKELNEMMEKEQWLRDVVVWMDELDFDVERAQEQAKANAKRLELVVRTAIDQSMIVLILSQRGVDRGLVEKMVQQGLFSKAVMDEQGRIYAQGEGRYEELKEKRITDLIEMADQMVAAKAYWAASKKGEVDWQQVREMAIFLFEGKVKRLLGITNQQEKFKNDIMTQYNSLKAARVLPEGKVVAPEVLRRFVRYYWERELEFDLDFTQRLIDWMNGRVDGQDHRRLVMYGALMLDMGLPDETPAAVRARLPNTYVDYMVGERRMGYDAAIEKITEQYFKDYLEQGKKSPKPAWFEEEATSLEAVIHKRLTFHDVMLVARDNHLDGCPFFSNRKLVDSLVAQEVFHLVPTREVGEQVMSDLNQVLRFVEGVSSLRLQLQSDWVKLADKHDLRDADELPSFIEIENPLLQTALTSPETSVDPEDGVPLFKKHPRDWSDQVVRRLNTLYAEQMLFLSPELREFLKIKFEAKGKSWTDYKTLDEFRDELDIEQRAMVVEQAQAALRASREQGVRQFIYVSYGVLVKERKWASAASREEKGAIVRKELEKAGVIVDAKKRTKTKAHVLWDSYMALHKNLIDPTHKNTIQPIAPRLGLTQDEALLFMRRARTRTYTMERATRYQGMLRQLLFLGQQFHEAEFMERIRLLKELRKLDDGMKEQIMGEAIKWHHFTEELLTREQLARIYNELYSFTGSLKKSLRNVPFATFYGGPDLVGFVLRHAPLNLGELIETGLPDFVESALTIIQPTWTASLPFLIFGVGGYALNLATSLITLEGFVRFLPYMGGFLSSNGGWLWPAYIVGLGFKIGTWVMSSIHNKAVANGESQGPPWPSYLDWIRWQRQKKQ